MNSAVTCTLRSFSESKINLSLCPLYFSAFDLSLQNYRLLFSYRRMWYMIKETCKMHVSSTTTFFTLPLPLDEQKGPNNSYPFTISLDGVPFSIQSTVFKIHINRLTLTSLCTPTVTRL